MALVLQRRSSSHRVSGRVRATPDCRAITVALLLAVVSVGCHAGRLAGHVGPSAARDPARATPPGRIAFIAQIDPHDFWETELVVCDPDGGNRVRLNDGVTGDSAWSPDGARIVCSAHARQPGLDVVEVATGQVTHLTSGTGFDGEPAWSPDGTRIAYVHDNSSVRIADLEDGSWRTCGAFGGMAFHPAWSADGRLVYFTAEDPSTRQRFGDVIESRSYAYRAEVASGACELVRSRAEVTVVPSPVDDRVAVFLRQTSGTALDVESPHEGSTRPIDPAGLRPDAVVWSPRGDRLVVQAYPAGADWFGMELVLVPLSGGAPERLTLDYGPETSISWSPDGTRIAFERMGKVIVMDLATHVETVIAEGEYPAWSP